MRSRRIKKLKLQNKILKKILSWKKYVIQKGKIMLNYAQVMIQQKLIFIQYLICYFKSITLMIEINTF